MMDFSFTDEDKYVEGSLNNSLYILYEDEKKAFSVRGYAGNEAQEEIIIDKSSQEYYYLLKIATSFDYEQDLNEAFKDWMEFLQHPIPRTLINFRLAY